MNNIIEVKKLAKKFKEFKAVDFISFFVKQGEIFAFLGPNGAGKTTTIKPFVFLCSLGNKKYEKNTIIEYCGHDDNSRRRSILWRNEVWRK